MFCHVHQGFNPIRSDLMVVESIIYYGQSLPLDFVIVISVYSLLYYIYICISYSLSLSFSLCPFLQFLLFTDINCFIPHFLSQSNPRSVCDHREIVLSCLTDDDITIRTRALELLAGIVSRKSLVDLVHHLLMVRNGNLFSIITGTQITEN